MENSPAKKPMTEDAKKNQPSPEQKSRWGKMVKVFVDNLNRNVKKDGGSE